ncbi:hypothetical protein Tco_0530571 [Tanacetum coccineum]
MISDLPILHYTRPGFMEMNHDIENMMINEYLEYEAEKERRLWRNIQAKSSPTRPPQPHNGCGYKSPDENDDVNIESITIAEYNLYIAKQGLVKNPLNDHSYGFTPQRKNLKQMGQENFHNNICEQDVDDVSDLEKEEAQVDDDGDGDIYDVWDITVEDVERIRQFFTPNILDVMDDVRQPLIPKTMHTTPPEEDFVAPATKSILDELLEEFGEEILNATMVDEEVDFNPTKDIEELERL